MKRACACGYKTHDRSNFRRHLTKCQRKSRTSCERFWEEPDETHREAPSDGIEVFGKEPTGVVPQNVVDGLALDDFGCVVSRFIEYKHFTGPPHTRNLRVPSVHSPIVAVVARDLCGLRRWTYADRTTIAEYLLLRTYVELQECYSVCDAWRLWATDNLVPASCPTSVWQQQMVRIDEIFARHRQSA